MKVQEFIDFFDETFDETMGNSLFRLFCMPFRGHYMYVRVVSVDKDKGQVILSDDGSSRFFAICDLYDRLKQLLQQHPDLPGYEIIYRGYADWDGFNEIKWIGFEDASCWCLRRPLKMED